MMQAYVVTVRPGNNDRYTDSVWIDRTNADRRAASLVREFIRRGTGGKVEHNLTSGWGAWVTEIDIEDGALGTLPTLPAANSTKARKR